MNNEARAKIERFVEVAVFAPVGVALTLRDMAPTFVNMFVTRGRAEVDRRQHGIERRVQTVKSTGEVALAFGVPMVRDRIVDGIHRLRGLDEATDAADGGDELDPVHDVATDNGSGLPAVRLMLDRPEHHDARADLADATAHPTTTNGSGGGADADMAAANLAIPGYDSLAASQVVERLIGLDAAELLAVRAYETEHRNRRTIVGKIDQLVGS